MLRVLFLLPNVEDFSGLIASCLTIVTKLLPLLSSCLMPDFSILSYVSHYVTIIQSLNAFTSTRLVQSNTDTLFRELVEHLENRKIF